MPETIAQQLADAAMTDAGLPYSLICDAWGLAEAAGFTDPTREEWKAFFATALATWQHARPLYQFNPRAK
jgi:hypothetical protein